MDELNDVDREHIAEQIKLGNNLGEIVGDNYRGSWSLDYNVEFDELTEAEAQRKADDLDEIKSGGN